MREVSVLVFFEVFPRFPKIELLIYSKRHHSLHSTPSSDIFPSVPSKSIITLQKSQIGIINIEGILNYTQKLLSVQNTTLNRLHSVILQATFMQTPQ